MNRILCWLLTRHALDDWETYPDGWSRRACPCGHRYELRAPDGASRVHTRG